MQMGMGKPEEQEGQNMDESLRMDTGHQASIHPILP